MLLVSTRRGVAHSVGSAQFVALNLLQRCGSSVPLVSDPGGPARTMRAWFLFFF